MLHVILFRNEGRSNANINGTYSKYSRSDVIRTSSRVVVNALNHPPTLRLVNSSFSSGFAPLEGVPSMIPSLLVADPDLLSDFRRSVLRDSELAELAEDDSVVS
jgi:hypothetical protein